MPQSNFIFGALAVAFLVFITARGSLPVYVQVFTGKSAGGSGDKSATDNTSNPAKDIAGVIGKVNPIGRIVGGFM